eukprot:PhF_6_TR25334/c0_g1_i4/m.35025
MLQSLLIVVILWQPLRGMGFVDVEWVVLCCHLNLNTTEDHTTVFRLTPPVFNPTTSSTPGLSCYVTVPNVTLTCVDPITITCADGAHCFELDAGVVSFTVYGPCTFRGMFLKSMSNRTNTMVSLSGGIRVEGTGSETMNAIFLVNVTSVIMTDVVVQLYYKGCIWLKLVQFDVTVRNLTTNMCFDSKGVDGSGLNVESDVGLVMIEDSSFFNSVSTSVKGKDAFGGCVFIHAQRALIRNSTFRNCSALTNLPVGGCLYAIGGNSSVLQLESSLFQFCFSAFSGAVTINYRVAIVRNITVLDSYARLAGGLHFNRQLSSSDISVSHVRLFNVSATSDSTCIFFYLTPKTGSITFQVRVSDVSCAVPVTNGNYSAFRYSYITDAKSLMDSSLGPRYNETRFQNHNTETKSIESIEVTETVQAIKSSRGRIAPLTTSTGAATTQKVVSSVVQIGTLLSTDGTTSYTTQLIPMIPRCSLNPSDRLEESAATEQPSVFAYMFYYVLTDIDSSEIAFLCVLYIVHLSMVTLYHKVKSSSMEKAMSVLRFPSMTWKFQLIVFPSAIHYYVLDLREHEKVPVLTTFGVVFFFAASVALPVYVMKRVEATCHAQSFTQLLPRVIFPRVRWLPSDTTNRYGSFYSFIRFETHWHRRFWITVPTLHAAVISFLTALPIVEESGCDTMCICFGVSSFCLGIGYMKTMPTCSRGVSLLRGMRYVLFGAIVIGTAFMTETSQAGLQTLYYLVSLISLVESAIMFSLDSWRRVQDMIARSQVDVAKAKPTEVCDGDDADEMLSPSPKSACEGGDLVELWVNDNKGERVLKQEGRKKEDVVLSSKQQGGVHHSFVL